MKKRNYWPWFFVLPAFIFLMAITEGPFLFAVWLSLHKHSIMKAGEWIWIGLLNYKNQRYDLMYWSSLVTTGIFATASVVLEFVLGMGIALMLDRISRGIRIITSAILIPFIMTPVVIGLTWFYILNSDFGILVYYLARIGIKFGTVLGSLELALPAVIAVEVWNWTPFMVLVLLAGLAGVSPQIREAAQVDGASYLQSVRHVILPSLRTPIVVACLLALIEAIKEFDKIFVLTRGGPSDVTEVASIYGFRVNFVFWDLGYGASIVLMIFLIVLLVCVSFYNVLKKKETR